MHTLARAVCMYFGSLICSCTRYITKFSGPRSGSVSIMVQRERIKSAYKHPNNMSDRVWVSVCVCERKPMGRIKTSVPKFIIFVSRSFIRIFFACLLIPSYFRLNTQTWTKICVLFFFLGSFSVRSFEVRSATLLIHHDSSSSCLGIDFSHSSLFGIT